MACGRDVTGLQYPKNFDAGKGTRRISYEFTREKTAQHAGESRARSRATAMTTARLFGVLALIMVCAACNRLGHYTLVSPDYGFSVTFPEKPSKVSDKNREGLPKHLWTVYRSDRKDFYSAQATSYKEALPTEGWLPGRAVGDLVGIQLLVGRRFKLRSAATGREAVAVATTSLAPGGGIISTIYVIDGTKLISVTARTENEQDKTAFLGSFKLLQ